MQESQKRIREAQQTNEELRKRIDHINQENQRYTNDAEERDRAVRKHMNKQKPGEVTIVLPGDEESDSSPKGDTPKR